MTSHAGATFDAAAYDVALARLALSPGTYGSGGGTMRERHVRMLLAHDTMDTDTSGEGAAGTRHPRRHHKDGPLAMSAWHDTPNRPPHKSIPGGVA